MVVQESKFVLSGKLDQLRSSRNDREAVGTGASLPASIVRLREIRAIPAHPDALHATRPTTPIRDTFMPGTQCSGL
jgi:hypothetical protein